MPSSLETRPQAIGPSDNKQMISPLAGLPAPNSMLVDVAKLEREYYERRPDLEDPNQMVIFGTSGHRGSPFHGTFT
jgi:phosphoglucomutase